MATTTAPAHAPNPSPAAPQALSNTSQSPTSPASRCITSPSPSLPIRRFCGKTPADENTCRRKRRARARANPYPLSIPLEARDLFLPGKRRDLPHRAAYHRHRPALADRLDERITASTSASRARNPISSRAMASRTSARRTASLAGGRRRNPRSLRRARSSPRTSWSETRSPPPPQAPVSLSTRPSPPSRGITRPS